MEVSKKQGFHCLKYKSFKEFIFDYISEKNVAEKIKEGFVFRGEGRDDYELIPSVLREKNKEKLWSSKDERSNQSLPKGAYASSELERNQVLAEAHVLKSFFEYSNDYGLYVPNKKMLFKSYGDRFSLGNTLIKENHPWLFEDVEILAALAQHYGVLTRMIDWSFNLYVALYFACTGAAREKKCSKNMVIWALNYKKILENPKQKERKLHFVVPPYTTNPNLKAQHGVLTYFESPFRPDKKYNKLKVDRTPLNKLIDEYYGGEGLLYKIELPTKCASEVYAFVDKGGYNAATLFPGYNGVVKYIEERTLMYKE